MSKGKLLALVVLWLTIFGVLAVAWKFIIQPSRDAAVVVEKERNRAKGSSQSRYDHRLNLSLDSFSGYAVLRSEEFAKELAAKSIKVNLVHDGADYNKRLAALKSGESHMAAFTIDALLKICSQTNDLPASIVAIIDESRGADAIMGYKSKYPNVDALSDPNLRFVLTPDSPSETLARVVMADYDLPDLGENPFITMEGAGEVYDAMNSASDEESQVYVMWEPYVTRATEDKTSGLGVIISTGNVSRYIVDVLVVQKDFLDQYEGVVKDVVESYFAAAFKYQSNAKKVELVVKDSKSKDVNDPLTKDRAQNVVKGIAWKNTQSNYAHFGIYPNESVSHIEDTIDRITKVLISTSGIANDPTDGQPNLIYFDNILKQLAAEDFHPDGKGNVEEDKLRSLSDEEWNGLVNVGNLRTERLVFRPSQKEFNERNQSILNDLADRLQAHRYYLKVNGIASPRGEPNESKEYATNRAQLVMDYLIERGIDPERMRPSDPEIGDAPTVTFTLGQLPY